MSLLGEPHAGLSLCIDPGLKQNPQTILWVSHPIILPPHHAFPPILIVLIPPLLWCTPWAEHLKSGRTFWGSCFQRLQATLVSCIVLTLWGRTCWPWEYVAESIYSKQKRVGVEPQCMEPWFAGLQWPSSSTNSQTSTRSKACPVHTWACGKNFMLT